MCVTNVIIIRSSLAHIMSTLKETVHEYQGLAL